MIKQTHLRHFFLIAGLLFYYFLVLYPFQETYHNPVKGSLSDAFHLPMFFALTVFLYSLTPKTSQWVRIVVVVVLGIIIAGYTELIQPQTGRNASWTDAQNGILGNLLAGYGLYFFSGAKKRLFILYCLTTAAACVLVLIPAYKAYYLQKHLQSMFPILATFEIKAELNNWRFYSHGAQENSSAQVTIKTPLQSKHALYLEAKPADYVGFEFYPAVHDFSGYVFFTFEVFNPGNEFILRLRIDDEKYPLHENRANLSFVIKPGLNRIAVPLKEIESAPKIKLLNIKTIRTIFFYLAKESTPAAFYLDNIALK